MISAAFDQHSADMHGNFARWGAAPASSDESDSGCEDSDDAMQVEPTDGGDLWMVKIPKHLMERWSAVEEEDVLLATIRVYEPAPGSSTSQPRVILTMPPDADDARLGLDQYEIDVRDVADAAKPYNEYLLSEHDPRAVSTLQGRKKGAKAPAKKRGRRRTFAQAVTHRCNLRAVFSERMRQRVRARTVAAATPKRQIKIYIPKPGEVRPECMPIHRPKPAKAPKGGKNRRVRASREALLDVLFRLFADRPRWSFKALQEQTRQPDKYLKEVLPEIAFLHRTGAHHGQWELSPSYGEKQDAGSANTSRAATPEEVARDIDDEGDMEVVY